MRPIEDVRKAFLEAADGLGKRLSSMSDAFYGNPETGLEEHATSGALQGFLRASGFAVESGVAGMPTAFRASYGSGRPAVALLAEMDALPGIGHGCGHNIAGVASSGAGAALRAALEGRLDAGSGSVIVLGTPAEELGIGKIRMIKAGVFRDIDAAMMAHASSGRTVVKHFLGLVRLNFTFIGRSSHASAYPEEGVNALDAVIQTFNSINALRQQLRRDVRVHGIVTEGGRAPNIIPERASASFYVRAGDLLELYAARDRVLKCAEGAALSTGCALQAVEEGEMNAPMRLNNALAGLYRAALSRVGLAEDQGSPERNVGSSDMGNVSQEVPSIHPHVLLRRAINIHTREFADATVTGDGHRALMEGVRCLGLTAIELILNPSALDAVKRDFTDQAVE
jgi:amidohydrolase